MSGPGEWLGLEACIFCHPSATCLLSMLDIRLGLHPAIVTTKGNGDYMKVRIHS